ncbi:hypothetical protein [Aquisphaera insulae]|uniref:hypothetical protein n=1 Tax=Aquisphaera insulae TaxID=2712864 RepID=UPI0013EA9185|nr:hypothetical protein [Aquisphaera insulae]
MSSHDFVIEGIVQPDGTLVLDAPAKLPAGRVRLIVLPLPDVPPGDSFWDMMQSIWADQEARGFVPRSAEQVEAERRDMREGWEERLQAIERLQAESRRLREGRP